jgi:gamma-glutamyl:cysteine ligase YbdK (ATP-grasp superfamily)
VDTALEAFKARFRFMPDRAGLIGIEREVFIVNRHCVPVPRAPEILAHLAGDPRFTYELSACQVEMRTNAAPIERVGDELVSADMRLRGVAREFGCIIDCTEVGDPEMSLAVYPDPTGRYQRIVETMPRDILRAACRIIGTHIHYGVSDHDSALALYNRLIKEVPRLVAMGDNSHGERMRLYRIVAPECDPPPYDSWADFYRDAEKHCFLQDPRKNWRLVRMTPHGTVEARTFGVTRRLDSTLSWAHEYHALCAQG